MRSASQLEKQGPPDTVMNKFQRKCLQWHAKPASGQKLHGKTGNSLRLCSSRYTSFVIEARRPLSTARTLLGMGVGLCRCIPSESEWSVDRIWPFKLGTTEIASEGLARVKTGSDFFNNTI